MTTGTRPIAAMVLLCMIASALCGCASHIIAGKIIAPMPSITADEPPSSLVDAVMRLHIGPPEATLYAWRLEPRQHSVFTISDESQLDAHLDEIDRKWSGTASVLMIKGRDGRVTCVATPIPGKSEAAPVEYRGTVLLMQGWGGGIRDTAYLLPLAACLSDAGYRVVFLDLRAQGDSTGQYLTWGEWEAKDISQVIDSLQSDGLAGDRVAVIGHSYGAGVAIAAAAADPRVATVIALSPPPALRKCLPVVRAVAKSELRMLYVLLSPWVTERTWQKAVDRAGRTAGFNPDRADPCLRIALTSARLLLMHGGRDTICPLSASQSICDARPQGSELVVWPDDDHGSYITRDGFREQVLRWLDEERLDALQPARTPPPSPASEAPDRIRANALPE